MIFTEKDLVSFGNYLLSEARMNGLQPEKRGAVHDADLFNWAAKQQREGFVTMKKTDLYNAPKQ